MSDTDAESGDRHRDVDVPDRTFIDIIIVLQSHTGDGMATTEAAIKVRDVSHQFGEEGDRRFVRALADTSLDVARGELLCLIGPSGCGKSTLLNVIGGLMRPSSGGVEVLGKKV